MKGEQIAVIGGGPAGLAAALAASEEGAKEIIIMERDGEPGGILNQCIHDGFGNIIFGESLTGPEYVERSVDLLLRRPGVRVLTGTMVLHIGPDRLLKAANREKAFELKPAAVILAMGCRERSRFQVTLPGYRPAGIYTAGAVQRLINMEGLMPGERAVILGSGDIGLIMARRLTLEGAQVCGVFEILPRPGGLTRNIVQCLQDFEIPLFLSHTVTFIHGQKRLSGVSVAPVDSLGKPCLEQERFIPCDTLILSVGLIPENELSRGASVLIDETTGGPRVDQNMATSVGGIFAGGNVVHVHDLVDHVSRAAAVAGKAAARFAAGRRYGPERLLLEKEQIDLYIRVSSQIRSAAVTLLHRGDPFYRKKMRMVSPPEMIHLELAPSLFKGLDNGEEILCCVAAEEVRGE